MAAVTSEEGSMAEPWYDQIHIRDLMLRCIVGINPGERTEKQEVIVNLTLHVNLRRAGKTDNLEETLDYRALKKKVATAVEGSEFFLVERLAEQVAELCLQDGRVRRVRVVIDKPGALRFARSVAVEIVRDAVTPEGASVA
jgi:D-erythro-7,8-dihydroneopterin triphosphate epimerase